MTASPPQASGACPATAGALHAEIGLENKKNDDDISAAPARRVSFALRATLGYAVLATIWILGIHELIERLEPSQLGLSPLQIDAGAGLLFVALTAALLYIAIKRAERRTADARIGFEPRAAILRTSTRNLLAVFVAASIALLALGYAWFRYDAKHMRDVKAAELSAVAHLKAEELKAWLIERRNDGELLARDPHFATDVAATISTGSKREKEHLLLYLESFVASLGYESASVFSPSGNIVLGVGDSLPEKTLPQGEALKALREREIVLTDPNREDSASESDLIIDILVPLYVSQTGAPAGVILLRHRAESFLFPLLHTWPVPSETAETLLLRREGEELVYLYEPGRRAGIAFALRRPLTERSLLEVRALDEPGAVLDGEDYRGVPVIAASRVIEGRGWLLVTKMDRSEVLRGAGEQAMLIFSLVFVLMASAGGAIAMQWAYQRRLYENRLLSERLEREALTRHFDYAVKYARDIVLLREETGKIVECNDAAVAAYGYSREELLQLDPAALRAPESRAGFAADFEKAAQAGGYAFETVHQRKDGSTFPVEVSTRQIEIEGGRFRHSIARDISARKAAEKALEREARRYKTLLETAIEGIHILDRKGRLVEANPAFLRMLGYEKQDATRLHVSDWDAQWNAEEIQGVMASILVDRSRTFETRHRRKDGSIREVEIAVSLLEIEGEPYFYGAARDITERKSAARRIERLTRMYATLSQTNEAIVRAGSEGELFQTICRVAVEHGKFAGALVGMADETQRTITPIALTENLKPYIAQTRSSIDPEIPEGRGPAGVAYREDRTYICNDFFADPATQLWREAARSVGIKAMVALPLRRSGKPIGVFALYAHETHFFDAEIAGLLNEMATDISFALNNFERETRRRQAESALAESEERFRGLVEQAIAGIYVVDGDRFAYGNPRAAEIFGYTVGELSRLKVWDVVAEEDRERVAENIRKRISGEVKSVQYTFTGIRKDGTRITVGVHGARATYQGRPMIIGLVQDISERERAQRQIESYMKQLEEMVLGTVNAVSTMVELRDPYTSGHERRVGALAAAIGAELGLSEKQCKGLEIIGAVHDVGKIAVPAEILSKPGRISATEYEIIKTHAQQGYDVLKNVEFPWPLAEAILQHHERLDGTGYPNGLKGDQIILEACIIAVADVVEAMASHRPYRPGLGLEAAFQEISRGRGVHYDANVVDACLRLFREKGYQLPA